MSLLPDQASRSSMQYAMFGKPDEPEYSPSLESLDDAASDKFEEDIPPGFFSPASGPRGRRKLSASCISSIGVIALIGFLVGWFGVRSLQTPTLVTRPMQHQQGQIMKKPCGESPEEARSRGCYFDIISFCWLPRRCYDSELSEGFDHAAEWEWFADPNRTQPLSHKQIMTGEYTGLYVNWEYHLLHCTSMWEKMHRALLGPDEKLAIDSYIGSYAHTKHCGHMLLSDRDVQLDVINTIILVKYPDCGMA